MTQTTNNKALSLDTLRRLALMQHLGEDYFFMNAITDRVFEGTEAEAMEQWKYYLSQLSEGEEKLSFYEYVSEHLPEVEELGEDDYSIDYMVLTDSEADAKWEISLDNYLEECVYPDLPDNLRNYFDDEKWKQDAKYDGRGHSLSSYDGNENEETVEGSTFYIYRTN